MPKIQNLSWTNYINLFTMKLTSTLRQTKIKKLRIYFPEGGENPNE